MPSKHNVKHRFPISPEDVDAIPNLKNVRLVKTYMKPITPWDSKKKTFVKAVKKAINEVTNLRFLHTFQSYLL